MKRRLLASILSLVMMLSLLPTAAWAVNGEGETGSDDGVVPYTGSENTDLTDDGEDGKGAEPTVTGPKWNFAPQKETVTNHAYSFYYNSSWNYEVEGYPGDENYKPQNAISLLNNKLPAEVNALIEAVEKAQPMTYTEIENIAKAAVDRGDISQQLYDRFCPEAEKGGSVIFHASDVSSANYDIRFHYDGNTWVATVEQCSDPTHVQEDSETPPNLALRNCWSGNGQRYLLFRGLVTKVTYEQGTNFNGAPAAFAKFYKLTDADLKNWPAKQISNNAFMTTALADDGVLDLSMLPDTVNEIGGYAFGRYDNMGNSSPINTVLLPKNMTAITIRDNAFSSSNSAVTIKGYLTDGDSIAKIKNAGYTYIDMNTFKEGDIGDNNEIHWTFSDGKLTVTGTGAIPDYNPAESKAPWAGEPVTELVIGDGITAIGAYAFYDLSSLKGTLTLPSSVESVGERAFALSEKSDDTALKLVYQKNTVIASTARENRTPVEADRVALLTGNYGAIVVGGEYDSAAGGLSKEPVLSGNVTYMIYKDGEDTVMELSGTGATANFSYGAGAPTIDATHANPQPKEIRGAEGYGRKVTKLIINEGITSLGYCAFDYFTALKEVVLPNSLTTIGSNAFHRAFASSDAKLYVANGYNEELAEQGYTIQFPSKVTSIGNYFAKYSGVGAEFGKVYFANPDTTINVDNRSYLFSNPDTITIAVSNEGKDCAVKDWASKYNIKYKDLTDQNAVEKTNNEKYGITYEVSGGVMYINTIEDPLKVTKAEVPADLLTPEQIKTVTKIVIGSGVKTIAANAFFDYTEVTEVSLPNTLTKIGSKAFGVTEKNDKLTTISIGKSAVVAEDAFDSRTMDTANVGKEEQKAAFKDVANEVKVDNTYSVLLIGNSYSEDASNCSPMTASRLQQMLQNAYPKKEVIVGLCYSGGKTMAWHYDKAMKRTSDYSLRIASGDGMWTSAGMMSSAAALSYMDWDVVSLQPYATETRTGTGENYHDEKYTYQYSLDESLGYMLHYVHCYAPSAKTYLYMTWEEVSDNTQLNAGADNYAKIVENLVTKADKYVGQYKNDDGSITVTEEKFTGVIPVGTAIQNERTSYLALLSHNETAIPGSVNLTSDPVRGLQRDGGHLSFNVGRYTAALTFAKKLTGENTDTLMKDIASAYPGTALSKLPEDYLTIMKTAVENAIEKPGEVTAFSNEYTTDPAVQAETAVEGTTYTYKVDTAKNYTEGGLKTYLEGAVNSAVSELKANYPELSVSVGNIDEKDGSFTANVTFDYGYTMCTAPVNGEINVTGHKYGEPTYTWSDDDTSCTAKKVCSVCKNEVTEPVTTTSSVKVAATCTTKGTKTYTATFSVANGFVTQTKNVDIAATGHDWSNKDGICAVCHTKCTETHKPGTTCEVCGKYTRRTSSAANPGNTVSVPSTPNGTVTVDPSTASKGETVTITTKPSEGYELGSIKVLDKNGDSLKLKDLGNGKYSFVMPDGKVSVEAEFVKTAATSFADVPANAYFADAVKWAVDKGITNGLSDTMFGPYESCTRAQIVTFLWRAAGSPEPKATTSAMTDLNPNAYYYKAVLWAIENGITDGMTETTFAPNATCTRGQSVTFLHRVLKGTASGSTNFTDVKSDAFYADAINWAVANNVTNGTSNTTFSPNADCTRAEIVTFLYRAYQGK